MTALKAATFAATTLAIVLSAVAPASALSIELAPGVEMKQDCKDKTYFATRIFHVRHGHQVIAVPKKVKITKTICENYYTKVSQNPPSRHPKPLAYPAYNPDNDSGVTGRNVGLVQFSGGAFEQRGHEWVETGPSGKVRFSFRETGRDRKSVNLYDRSRNVRLELDLKSDTILYEGRPLYRITSVAR